jgi:hypothetical protein
MGIAVINKLAEMSRTLAEDRKSDPDQIEIMNRAAKEQAPRFLLISQISRSTQDFQLLKMRPGDSFQAIRIPGLPLLPPKESLFLFAGPTSYNRNFPHNEGIVVTFDKSDQPKLIRQTIDSISKHPSHTEIPVVALIVDYDHGEAHLGVHGKDRNYELEIWLLKQVARPDYVDERVLVILCSDSRVRPPASPRGAPMAIQTLGGYIPAYTGKEDETAQLDAFFHEWLIEYPEEKQIIVAAHGAFTSEGASCGAGEASLNQDILGDKYLRMVINRITEQASEFEVEQASNAEERVKTIAKITRQNLLTYPAIDEYLKSNQDRTDFIQVALIDTVTNVLDEFID